MDFSKRPEYGAIMRKSDRMGDATGLGKKQKLPPNLGGVFTLLVVGDT